MVKNRVVFCAFPDPGGPGRRRIRGFSFISRPRLFRREKKKKDYEKLDRRVGSIWTGTIPLRK